MPKRSNTRKQRVKMLLERVNNGPYLVAGQPFSSLTPEQVQEVKNQYRIWVNSWILPEIRALLRHDIEA